jgi:gas vesicle protein
MNSGLTYTYEDLIQKSGEIKNFTYKFSGQLEELLNTASNISQNYQSEEATKVINAIQKVEEDAEDFKEAIAKFADVISEEIAPTYKAIEEETSDAVSDIYS